MSPGPPNGSSDPPPADGPSSLPAGRPSESVSDASETSLTREIGPYRLERLLGSGGMGEVYQAYDRRLQRRVAIKHFRPGSPVVGSTAGGTASRERFLCEARAAAGLSHPSIVHIHDILEHEGGDWEGDWIVMERVDGPTVAQLVAQGPLPVERAITIARQVAEGLEAAHQQGILHRDLKSENVMLARDGRAKILDFGLAKRLWPGEMEASLSLEGRVLGTCRTMSPEQARGQELDARSDLFALGVLLHEMLTGESPFLADTHVDTLARVCHHHPAPVAEANPEVPGELSDLVGWLLRKERELRPSDAREVTEVLAELDATLSRSGSVARSGFRSGASDGPATARSEDGRTSKGRWSPQLGSTLFGETLLDVPGSDASRPGGPEAPPSRPPGSSGDGWRWSLASLGLDSPYRPSVRHRVVLATAVGLAAMVGLLTWSLRTVLFSSDAPTVAEATPAVRPAVAVLGFKNLSRDEGVAWISTGIAEMLNAELAASPELRTVAGETIARAKRELALEEGETLGAPTLSKVRSILGADKVVVGSYLAVPGGEELRLVLNVQDTAAGTTQTTLSETASRTEILDLVRRVGDRVRRELGSGPVSADGTRAARATLPKSSEALELYAEGLRQMRAYELVQARDLFQQAVKAEPEFPLAHAALAEAWSALGYDSKAQKEAARAVELAGKLSREDRLFVEARDHEMSWRWDQAIQSYRTLWDFFPDNVEYGLRLADALTTAGRGREALGVVAAMRELPAPASADVRIDLAEADAARSLAEYQLALEAAKKAASRGDAMGARLLFAEARLTEGIALLRLGRAGEAKGAMERSHKLFVDTGEPRGEVRALNAIAHIAYDRGRFSRAMSLFGKTLETTRRIGNLEWIAGALQNQADILLVQGRLDEAGPLLTEALDLVREAAIRPQESLVLTNLAYLGLRQGELSEARSRAAEAIRITRDIEHPYARQARLFVEGSIRLAGGELGAAEEDFEAGLDLARGAQDPYQADFQCHLGLVELARRNFPDARAHLEEALRMRESLGNEPLVAEAEAALAWVALGQGRMEEALERSRRAAAVYRRHGLIEGEARALTGEILVFAMTDRLQAAREARERLDSLLPRCQTVTTRIGIGIQLARIAALEGDEDGAASALVSLREEAAGRGLDLLVEQAGALLTPGRGLRSPLSRDAGPLLVL